MLYPLILLAVIVLAVFTIGIPIYILSIIILWGDKNLKNINGRSN